MFVDQFGKHIQFSQYPGLTFSSMEAAFNYFEAHAKLQKQRAIQANARLVDCAAQQARRPQIPDPCEQMWRFDTSLEPANVRPVVRLPPPCLRQEGPCSESAAESISQGPFRAPDRMYPSSRWLPPETPPHTLFAESTPHARDIQAQIPVEVPAGGFQSWPPVELPAEELQSSTIYSQATNGFGLQSFLPSPEVLDQANSLAKNHSALRTDHKFVTPSPFPKVDNIIAQPQSSYGSYRLASSYLATALPQTLVQKDMRVLGVPLTADIDE